MQAIKYSLKMIRDDLVTLLDTNPVVANSTKRAGRTDEILTRIPTTEIIPDSQSVHDITARKLLHLMVVACLIYVFGLLLAGELTV